MDKEAWAFVERYWQGEDEVLGRNTCLGSHFVHYRPRGLAWHRTRASAVRCGRRTAWAMTRTILSCDVHTHVSFHMLGYIELVMYEAKLPTYVSTLWHFFFLNYHSRSLRKARCFHRGSFYCPVICPLLNADILSWLKRPCGCVRWLMWQSEWSVRSSGVGNSDGTQTNLQTSCMFPHSVWLAP